MSTKERLQCFIKTMGYGRNALSEELGIANGYFSSKAKSVQSDTIEKIIAKFPDLNLDWLFTGKGEMLNPSQVLSIDGNNNVGVGNISSMNGGKVEVHNGKEHEKLSEERMNDIKKKNNYISGAYEHRISRYEVQLDHAIKQIELKDSVIADLNEKITKLLQEDKVKLQTVTDMQKSTDFSEKREFELLDRIKKLTEEMAAMHLRYNNDMKEVNERYAKLVEMVIGRNNQINE
jgi:hypothetical protein